MNALVVHLRDLFLLYKYEFYQILCSMIYWTSLPNNMDILYRRHMTINITNNIRILISYLKDKIECIL